MAGHHKFSQLRDHMAPERQAQNQAATATLLAKLPAQLLAQAYEQAHGQIESQGGRGQSMAAELAQHTEQYVQTLRACIAALGGTLEITARFPAGAVPITHFAASPPTLSDVRE